MRTRKNYDRRMFEPDIYQIKKARSSRSVREVRHEAKYSSEPLTWETNSGDWRLSGCCRRPPERRKDDRKLKRCYKIKTMHNIFFIFKLFTQITDHIFSLNRSDIRFKVTIPHFGKYALFCQDLDAKIDIALMSVR